MVLKVSPILGPSKRTTLMTTSATNARMIAYSTSPCPLSFGANNIRKILSLKKISLKSQNISMTLKILESYNLPVTRHLQRI